MLQATQDQVCYARWCRSLPSLIARGKLHNLQLITWSGPDGDVAGPQGAMELAEALKQPHRRTTCPHLHIIDFAGDRIELEGARALAEALMERGAAAVSSGVSGRQGLCTLDLNGNGIGEEGARSLGEALGRPGVADRLHTLKLSFNNMGIEGTRAVVEGLLRGVRAQLIHLDIGGNNLGDDGAVMVAEALISRGGAGGCFASLQSLDLSFNLIGAHGARAVAYALMTQGVCGGLNRLELGFNGVDEQGSQALIQLVAQRG